MHLLLLFEVAPLCIVVRLEYSITLVPCKPSNGQCDDEHQGCRGFGRYERGGTRQSEFRLVAEGGDLLVEVGLEVIDLIRIGRVHQVPILCQGHVSLATHKTYL